jgi:hypothetical protein
MAGNARLHSVLTRYTTRLDSHRDCRIGVLDRRHEGEVAHILRHGVGATILHAPRRRGSLGVTMRMRMRTTIRHRPRAIVGRAVRRHAVRGRAPIVGVVVAVAISIATAVAVEVGVAVAVVVASTALLSLVAVASTAVGAIAWRAIGRRVVIVGSHRGSRCAQANVDRGFDAACGRKNIAVVASSRSRELEVMRARDSRRALRRCCDMDFPEARCCPSASVLICRTAVCSNRSAFHLGFLIRKNLRATAQSAVANALLRTGSLESQRLLR